MENKLKSIYILGSNITISIHNSNIAVFNVLTGDTHFMSHPFSLVIVKISQGAVNKQDLFKNFCDSFITPSLELKDLFEEAISEAIKSGIIIDTQQES